MDDEEEISSKSRAVARWFEDIRPTMVPPIRQIETRSQAKARLRAMRQDLSDDEFEAMFATFGIPVSKAILDKMEGTPS